MLNIQRNNIQTACEICWEIIFKRFIQNPHSTHKFLPNWSCYFLTKIGIPKTNSAYITPAACKRQSLSSQQLTWISLLLSKNCLQIKNPQLISVQDHIKPKPPSIHSSSISTYLDYSSSISTDCSQNKFP